MAIVNAPFWSVSSSEWNNHLAGIAGSIPGMREVDRTQRPDASAERWSHSTTVRPAHGHGLRCSEQRYDLTVRVRHVAQEDADYRVSAPWDRGAATLELGCWPLNRSATDAHPGQQDADPCVIGRGPIKQSEHAAAEDDGMGSAGNAFVGRGGNLELVPVEHLELGKDRPDAGPFGGRKRRAAVGTDERISLGLTVEGLRATYGEPAPSQAQRLRPVSWTWGRSS